MKIVETVEATQYDAAHFDLGEKVRIYLAWGTDTEIHIREGEVTNTQIKKKWGGDSLQLRVNKKGMLLRREPRDTVVLNSDGSWVQGTLDLENIDQEYTASYHYSGISLVEKLE